MTYTDDTVEEIVAPSIEEAYSAAAGELEVVSVCWVDEEAEARAAHRASAKAKLVALGLTGAEADAFEGGGA